MYQRRAKRVAGPGFHVNVKMDQFQIATMRGRSATANGMSGTSELIPSSNLPEMYDIKEQEILVAKRTSGAMYHDGYTHVFSVVNGFDVSPLPLGAPASAVRDKILEQVRFVGIATTEQKADDRLIDQGCVATVGGVVTVLNGGTKPIHPTDKVMLDINLSPGRASVTREKGIPRQKVRFTFRPADDDERLIGRALNMCDQFDLGKYDKTSGTFPDRVLYENAVKAAKAAHKVADKNVQAAKLAGRNPGKAAVLDSTGNIITAAVAAEDQGAYDTRMLGLRQTRADKAKALAEAEANLKNCSTGRDKSGALLNQAGDTLNKDKLKQFLQNYRHLNELVIGKAMSYAAPGDRFEILLQPRHSL